MRGKAGVILWSILVFAVNAFAVPLPNNIIKTDIVTISVEQQYREVRPGSKSALAVHFELKKDWHFYASAETAAGGMNLKIKPSAKNHIDFSGPIFPKPQMYFDKSSGKKLEVFSNKFTVFLPFSVELYLPETVRDSVDVEIGIDGAVCSDIQCRVPDFGELSTEVKISPDATMSNAKFTLPDSLPLGRAVEYIPVTQLVSYSIWFAFGLAFLAGLSLNIMPCVWPVLPLIVMRIVEQAKQSRKRSMAMGFAFCLGILLFFGCLAGANIVLQIFYGTVLQWGDQFRSPGFVAGMALLLVVLALFMFGVFTIGVPSSIVSKSGSGKGYGGAVGMGFLAAILSTPCSFAILAAAFAWAQAQPLLLATLAIVVIGVGMALPYAVLTSMPGLLKRLPKAGRWMELFKQTIGFVLLGIAVWFITALPQARRGGVLYFALVLSFGVWMWSGWVSYNIKLAYKLVIRTLAVVLVLFAGLMFLTEPIPSAEPIDWQPYNADLIESAIAENRPVLLKFTADWCLSCRMAEINVYSQEEINRLVNQKNVLAIKADTTTKQMPATKALKNIYKEPGVPVSMLFLPGRQEPLKWRGKSFANELEEQLEKLPYEKQ